MVLPEEHLKQQRLEPRLQRPQRVGPLLSLVLPPGAGSLRLHPAPDPALALALHPAAAPAAPLAEPPDGKLNRINTDHLGH